MIHILLLLLGLALTAPANAQGCGPQNPQCIVNTQPDGTSNSAAASTTFVQRAVPFAAINSPGASADATTLLTNAFANAATKPVYLNCGTYNTKNPLTIPASGIVRGEQILTYLWPSPGTGPCVQIIADNSSGNFTAGGTAVITMSDFSTLGGVGIKGTNVAGQADGININGIFVIIENSQVASANNGIICQLNKQGANIRNNLIGNSKNMGILIQAGCSDGYATGNYLYTAAVHNLEILVANKWVVTGNTIEWATQHGIVLFGNGDLIIANNTFDHNGSCGIHFNGTGATADTVTVSGNAFSRNGVNQTANLDAHICATGTSDNITFAGNSYRKADRGDGTIVPNYLYSMSSTPVFTNSRFFDEQVSQQLGIYNSATTKNALFPSVVNGLPAHPGYATGRYYWLGNVFSAAGTAVPTTDTVVFLYPFVVYDNSFVLTSLNARTVTGQTGCAIKFAVWLNNPSTARPTGTPIVGSNTGQACTASGSNQTVSVNYTFVPGQVYWAGTAVTTGGANPAATFISVGATYYGGIGTGGSLGRVSVNTTDTSVAFTAPYTYATDIMALDLTGATYTDVTGSGAPMIKFGN